jgi:hypothetical protein
MRSKLIRRRVSKRVNQWTERETRCEIKTKPSQLTQGLQQEQTERTEMKKQNLCFLCQLLFNRFRASVV